MHRNKLDLLVYVTHVHVQARQSRPVVISSDDTWLCVAKIRHISQVPDFTGI